MGILSLMPHDLDWEGCFAIVDLGGLSTPHGVTASGVFVRGDNVRNLTPSGWRQAADYGIQTVLDLRSGAECVADPRASAADLSVIEAKFVSTASRQLAQERSP